MSDDREAAERFYREHSRLVRVDDLKAGNTAHGRAHTVVLWQGGLEDVVALIAAARREA